MIQNFKSLISRNLTNYRGWTTKRKIIVIESDDWGSIRMPNKNVRETFINKGYNLGNNPYCKFDTLANSDDLNALFDILYKFKNKFYSEPKITFNTVVANPNFDKIKDTGFKKYFYEPFTDTLQRYYPNQNVFKLWEQGISENLIKPQFHGREHVNVIEWLKLLRLQNKPLLDAFYLNFWGLPKQLYGKHDANIQASFSSVEKNALNFFKNNIIQGVNLFKEIFNYQPTSFIPNNYIFPNQLLVTLQNQGIEGIQSMRYQKIPISSNKTELKNIYTGKCTKHNQVYTIRNALFDPLQTKSTYDDVKECLSEIKNAFFWNKPAIINSHRLVYIGAIEEKNRTQNLEKFNLLLTKIYEKWPDVEFLSSDELINEIKEYNNSINLN